MAILEEKEPSRQVSIDSYGTTVTRIFSVEGEDDPEAFRSSGQVPKYGSAHPEIPSLFVTGVKIAPQEGWLRMEVTYAPKEHDVRENKDLEVWGLDYSGQQTHITSVGDPSKQIHAPPWQDCGTAIGLDGDDIHGVDVFRPRGMLTCTKRFPDGLPADKLRAKWFSLISTVNDKAWQKFAPGEALFLGIGLEPITMGQWAVKFNFYVVPTQVGSFVQLVDGEVWFVDLPPWDYMWFRHQAKIKGETVESPKLPNPINLTGGDSSQTFTALQAAQVAADQATAALAAAPVNTPEWAAAEQVWAAAQKALAAAQAADAAAQAGAHSGPGGPAPPASGDNVAVKQMFPLSFHIAQVYGRADFDGLGLSGPT